MGQTHTENFVSVQTVTVSVTHVITLAEIRLAHMEEPSMSLEKALEKGESKPVWEEMSPCVPDFKSVLGSMEYVVCERWVCYADDGYIQMVVRRNSRVMLPPCVRKLVLK